MCERNSHACWRTRSTSPLSGPMPKSQKARKQARFNPLAAARRAAEGQEEPGTSAAAAEEAPKLSAHQLRHIERKRLQAETAALRSSKLKVSKADKVQHKRDKKALARELKQA